MALQDCLCCPDWTENLGSQEDCDTCDQAGNSSCFAIICRNYRTHVKNPLVVDEPKSGKLTDVVLVGVDTGVNAFSKKDTLGWTSSETKNDNEGFDVSETMTMVGRLSQSALNWIRKYKGKCVSVYWEDNCGVVWSADLDLNDYTADIEADSTGQRGITINFTNTTEDPFCEVDVEAPLSANYSNTDEFFDYIAPNV